MPIYIIAFILLLLAVALQSYEYWSTLPVLCYLYQNNKGKVDDYCYPNRFRS